MIVLVDLRISNIGSVRHAIARAGCPAPVAATPEMLQRASAVLLPGVGAFGDGMTSLRDQGLVEPIREAAKRGVPVFGICLGMQLLASESEEHGRHQGLGLMPGRVMRLSATQKGFRVPNIGWCDTRATKSCVLFDSMSGGCFYHVHSYHFVPENDRSVAACINYSGQDVVVAVEEKNVFGVQFHPEKSQDDGLDLLARFFRHLRITGWLN